MALKTANRDGINLCYVDEGAGDPPLLFVHRWCCAHSHWRDQTSEFGLTNRVVAVDLRGHGASDKPDQNYTIGGFVDDVAWLIGKTGLQRPVVIGHSMGGVITANLARKHPKASARRSSSIRRLRLWARNLSRSGSRLALGCARRSTSRSHRNSSPTSSFARIHPPRCERR